MNDEFVNDVLRDMLAYLDNGQAEQLRRVLKHNLSGYEIQRRTDSTTEDASAENARLTGAFLSAKRIEGCSEKYKNSLNEAKAEKHQMRGRNGKASVRTGNTSCERY